MITTSLQWKRRKLSHKDTHSLSHTHTVLTCRDEENTRAEDDIVSAPVKLTGGNTQPPQEQQTHAHDGEDTGGTDSTFTQTHTQTGKSEDTLVSTTRCITHLNSFSHVLKCIRWKQGPPSSRNSIFRYEDKKNNTSFN